MAEEKLIQISLQLPVSELAGVSVLLEQMRQLLATGRETSAPRVGAESSGGFDEARFQALAQAATAAEGGADAPAPVTTVEHDLNMESLQISVAEAGEATALEAEVQNEIAPAVSDVAAEGEIDVSPLRVSVEEGIAAPSTADYTLSDSIGSFLPERRRNAEQLAAAGPAPLTAEAVSIAFRRDDRRYDNGFPLY